MGLWWRKKPVPKEELIKSDVGKVFVQALKLRPDDFLEDDHVLKDRATGFIWWKSNQAEHFTFWDRHAGNPPGAFFPLEERPHLWQAFQQWRADRINEIGIKGNQAATIKLAMALKPEESKDGQT